MSRVIRRQAARQDLVEIAYYYIRQGSPATARRFRDQAEALFRRLAGMPGMGAAYDPSHPALAGLRFMPVTRFKKYLVFYRAIPSGIEVIRVLHGVRDIDGILSEEFGIEEDDNS
jgi:toxin ParE1/3/4